MDIERLKEFLVIAEAGSFKEAAKVLGIAPSVLSSRFSGFEVSLNTKLLYRNNHMVKPTESGMLLLKNAPELVAGWETLKTSVRSVNDTSIGSLKIQLCARTMPSELGPFLDIYSRNNPGLFLDLYDENKCHINDGILSRETDIVFTPGRDGDFADLPGKLILSHFEHLNVHVPYDHRLSGKQSVGFDDLSGETFILYPEMNENHIRNMQLSILKESGISYQIYDSKCPPYFYDLMVPIGKGIAFWNWSDQVPPNSVNLSIKDDGFVTYYYMLYDPDNDNPLVQEFIDLFISFRKERL